MLKRCKSPRCLTILPESASTQDFCARCRKHHSSTVLELQVEHSLPIKEIIMEARMFQSAVGMSDYLDVSFVTLYNWIDKYFKDEQGNGMNFQEFKRTYICRSNCYMLDIKRSSYSRNDYILQKIKNKGKCACINTMAPNLIMTNAPPKVISEILRGAPRIKKITDDLFTLAPSPVKLKAVKPFLFSRKGNPVPVKLSISN